MGDLLNTGLAVVAIATLAGLGLMRGIITNLREQLKDAREETASHRLARTEYEKKITDLESKVAVLTSTVTGEVHWVALEGKFDDNQRAVLDVLAQLRDLLTEIRDLNRS